GLRRCPGRGGPGPRREQGRPLPGGPSPPRRRALAAPLPGVPAGRRERSPRPQGREDGPVHPDGTKVLMANDPESLGQAPPTPEQSRDAEATQGPSTAGGPPRPPDGGGTTA